MYVTVKKKTYYKKRIQVASISIDIYRTYVAICDNKSRRSKQRQYKEHYIMAIYRNALGNEYKCIQGR